MDNIIIVALYVAIPAALLTIAFIAILRREEKEIEEDKRQETTPKDTTPRHTAN